MSKNFETLKEAYPIFVVENKLNVSKNILLADNEDMTVPAMTTVEIESKTLIQIPDSKIFKLKSPPLEALIEHNIVKVNTPEPKVPPKGEKTGENNT